MKRPDLLILITVWQFITAFIALIGICAIAVFVFPDAVGPLWGPAQTGVIFAFSISILVLLVFIGIAIAGGIGILRGQEWGRVLSIVHAALGLFSFPIGTVIGILVIIYLTKSEVSDYFKAGSEKT
ncbi:MAG: hypothetical protein MUO90_03200 [Dehalococcoidales bacterium]|nr:hypothetical protein [Dehalococcoidales bacterium]